ncbi:hypothetical protein H4219_002812 [Mycoemilia scoparia]|uniref:Uncharacterized protein n=1 Tax=Mycoemilia scoparia TaxID=417184 RepID=A0A9W7ZWJ2_9FUNG|nr:hypothetical protein H4219_002812 [Mycoemilia scoparia]
MAVNENPIIAQYLAEVARAKKRAEEKKQQETLLKDAFDTKVKIEYNNQSAVSKEGKKLRPVYGIIKTSDSKYELRLPPPPQRPGPEDCCQNGCVPCIMDTYRETLEEYEAKVAKLKTEYAKLCTTTSGPAKIVDRDTATGTSGSFDQVPKNEIIHCDEEDIGENYDGCLLCECGESTASCACNKDGKIDGRPEFPINPLTFRSLSIHSIHNPSPSSIIIELDWIIDDVVSSKALECGWHIHIRVPIHRTQPTSGTQNGSSHTSLITRAFTPVFVPISETSRRACLYIRLYDNNAMSTHFKAMTEKDKLLVRGPLRTNYDTRKIVDTENLLLFGAGSGIAPLYQILDQRSRHTNASDNQKGKVLLIYCCQTMDQVWLEDRLIHMLSQQYGCQLYLFISQGARSQMPVSSRLLEHQANSNTRRNNEGPLVHMKFCRLTTESLQEIVKRFLDQSNYDIMDSHSAVSVICGPKPFNKDLGASLHKLFNTPKSCHDSDNIITLE